MHVPGFKIYLRISSIIKLLKPSTFKVNIVFIFRKRTMKKIHKQIKECERFTRTIYQFIGQWISWNGSVVVNNAINLSRLYKRSTTGVTTYIGLRGDRSAVTHCGQSLEGTFVEKSNTNLLSFSFIGNIGILNNRYVFVFSSQESFYLNVPI